MEFRQQNPVSSTETNIVAAQLTSLFCSVTLRSTFRHRGGLQAAFSRRGAKRSQLRGHEEGCVCGPAEAQHPKQMVFRPRKFAACPPPPPPHEYANAIGSVWPRDSLVVSSCISDFNLHGQTHEGVLVPEPVGQADGVAHQKDSHKDRQLSGQNQNRHLRPPPRGRSGGGETCSWPSKTSRGWIASGKKTRVPL